MRTPVETVADSLIAFILSLLRDPAAREEFDAEPQVAMAARGLQDACAADVRAVAPVVIDSPAVVRVPNRPDNSNNNTPTINNNSISNSNDDPVVNEIQRIVNQFTTIDARSTVVDMSTNQNIWTAGGDVNQIFDQEANVASGDGAQAAGDDATMDNSDSDITAGDVNIGNTTDSNNQTDSNNTTTETDASTNVTIDEADDVDLTVTPVEEPAPVEAAPLMDDMTAAESADTSDALPPAPEPYVDEPVEED